MPSADNRDDVIAARQYPCDGELRDRNVVPVDLGERFDELEAPVQVRTLEARAVRSKVVGFEFFTAPK